MNQLTIWSQQQNKSIGLTQPRHRVETAWPLQHPHHPEIRQNRWRKQAQGCKFHSETIKLKNMEKAKIINSGSFTPDNSYFAWLNDVKAKLHRSQIKASLRINQGFSVTNLRYMKNWYLFYNQCFTNRYQVGNDLDKNSMPEILAYIPWRHHIDILREYQGMLQSLT